MKRKLQKGHDSQTRIVVDHVAFFLIVVTLLLNLFTGCKKTDISNENGIDDYLKSLTPISEAMSVEKPAEVIKTEIDSTVEYITRTDYYSVAAGFNEQIVLNPQTDVIYPSALIKGESILDGTYTLIPAVRKPITLSTSLTGASSVSIEVNDPKLSTIREAVNSLMNQEYDVPPANMGFTIEQAYSKEQLDLSLHASYKSVGAKVSGGFDYSKTNIKTRLVAKFIQSYYTIDMDLPNQPTDLFDENVDKTLFGVYMPMYVSTVTYGRMALFTIESELEEKDVRIYLNGSYKGVKSGSAEAKAEFQKLTSSSTMKVYILGGSGSSASATIDGFEAFQDYIKDGGNYSKESPGGPISYKLRYINDNSIGKIVFAASYPIVTSIPRTDNVVYDISTILYQFETHIDDAGSGCELFGEISSYPKIVGHAKHEHWKGMTEMPNDNTRKFVENSKTKKIWKNLHHTDTIRIYINIKEDDTPIIGKPKHDQFTKSSFDVSVSDILEKSGDTYFKRVMKVREGASDWVKVTFKFKPRTIRIEDKAFAYEFK